MAYPAVRVVRMCECRVSGCHSPDSTELRVEETPKKPETKEVEKRRRVQGTCRALARWLERNVEKRG